MGIRSGSHGRPSLFSPCTDSRSLSTATVAATCFRFRQPLSAMRQLVSSRTGSGTAAFRLAGASHDHAPRARRLLAGSTGYAPHRFPPACFDESPRSVHRLSAIARQHGGTLHRRVFRRCFIACRRPASGFRSCSRRFAFHRSAFSRRIEIVFAPRPGAGDLLHRASILHRKPFDPLLHRTSALHTSTVAHVASPRRRSFHAAVGHLLHRAIASMRSPARRTSLRPKPAQTPSRATIRRTFGHAGSRRTGRLRQTEAHLLAQLQPVSNRRTCRMPLSPGAHRLRCPEGIGARTGCPHAAQRFSRVKEQCRGR
jgi:hypothetical protein